MQAMCSMAISSTGVKPPVRWLGRVARVVAAEG